MKKEKSEQSAERVTWAGIFGNLILISLKAFAGIVGNSQAMVADAVHSISDLFTTTIVLIGLKISKQPIDERHPYGHGKAESIAAASVGLILAGMGLTVLGSTVRTISRGRPHPPGMIALWAAVVSVVSKEIMFRYTMAVGEDLNSLVIKASAWDHRSDAYSSLAALVGIGGARLGLPLMDSLAGAGVSLIVIKTAYSIVIDAVSELMDTRPPQEIIDKIVGVGESIKGVEHVHEVKARRMGRQILVDLKVDIDPDVSVANGHAIAGEVKHKIIEEIDNVADVMVHVNPHRD